MGNLVSKLVHGGVPPVMVIDTSMTMGYVFGHESDRDAALALFESMKEGRQRHLSPCAHHNPEFGAKASLESERRFFSGTGPTSWGRPGNLRQGAVRGGCSRGDQGVSRPTAGAMKPGSPSACLVLPGAPLQPTQDIQGCHNLSGAGPGLWRRPV